ncbi:MAG: tyrosine-type recombinase/integrase [Deltaproteobacteria bacterium]|jgi:integrase|nr:tyrosine-type recombinase/integrase [Deltaproteobacteria bacterium]
MAKLINKSNWAIDFRCFSPEKGRKIRIRKQCFKRRKDAEKAERSIRDLIADAEYFINLNTETKNEENEEDEEMVDLDELWSTFMLYKKSMNLKHSTIDSYNSFYRVHFQNLFKEASIDNLEELVDLLLSNLKARKITGKTCNNVLCALNSFFKYLKKRNHIDYNPEIEYVKQDKPAYRYLKIEEQKKILSTIDSEFYLICYLALKTGLRFGELRALKWSDINSKEKKLIVKRSYVRRRITTTKSRKTRTIPLSSSTINLLNKTRHSRSFVFSDPDGSLPDKNRLYRGLVKAAKKADIQPFGWHVLRHTFATNLANENVPVVVIKELLGHSDVNTTMIYAHPTRKAKVDAIMHLDLG